MKEFHSFSRYRLLECSKDVCIFMYGNCRFKLMENSKPNFVKSYYVVECLWEDECQYQQVIPLARIHCSTKEDRVVWQCYQPDAFDIRSDDAKILLYEINETINMVYTLFLKGDV